MTGGDALLFNVNHPIYTSVYDTIPVFNMHTGPVYVMGKAVCGEVPVAPVRHVLQDSGGNCASFCLLDFLRCVCILCAIRKIHFSSQIAKYLFP